MFEVCTNLNGRTPLAAINKTEMKQRQGEDSRVGETATGQKYGSVCYDLKCLNFSKTKI